jgi:hypothetical protein
VNPIVGHEEDQTADHGELSRAGGAGAGADVGDQAGAGVGAVGLPELGATDPVVGDEEDGRSEDDAVIAGIELDGFRIDAADRVVLRSLTRKAGCARAAAARNRKSSGRVNATFWNRAASLMQRTS